MSKELGQLSKLKINVDECFIPFKNLDMDFNKLAILTGMNSSGKSVLNKLTWCLSMVMNTALTSKSASPELLQMICQEILDGTFFEQDIDGSILAKYDCGSSIEIKIDKGKVIDFKIDYAEGTKASAIPIYMSTETRKISYTANYMKFKKSVEIDDLKFISGLKAKLLADSYRIYDYLFMEKLIEIIRSGKQNMVCPDIEDDGMTIIEKRLSRFDSKSFGIKKVFLDEVNCRIMIEINGSKKDCNVLGAGEQSLLTMLIGTL